MTYNNNTFSGENALFDYLNPTNGNMSPLVEMPHALNPYMDDYNIHIHAKMLNALPLGNVKSIPAFHMLQEHPAQNNKTKIIESSSGNTVASLGVLSRYFGYDETKAFVSHEVSEGKLKMLRLFGVSPIVNLEPICPSENDMESGIHKARQKGKEAEWYNPDQYANPANIQAHYNVTGKEIWLQTDGRVDYFCSSLGTTGTFIGTSQFLKEQKETIQSIGFVRAPNNPIPGPRTKNLLNDVAFQWQEASDAILEIGTVSAYASSLALIRSGLIVGPSSGMNYSGTMQFIKNNINAGHFQKGQKDIHLVFPCCDTPYPYADDYFNVLPESCFPPIENKNLLLFSSNMADIEKPEFDIDAYDLLSKTQDDPDNNIIVDIREKESFQHYHIPNAVNIPMNDFITHVDLFQNMYNGKNLYLVCDYGKKSHATNQFAQKKKIQSYSLKGGMTEWSRLNLPREKDPHCVNKFNNKCAL